MVFSLAKYLPKGMANLWKGCAHLLYSQVDRDRLALYELNKGTLAYSQP